MSGAIYGGGMFVNSEILSKAKMAFFTLLILLTTFIKSRCHLQFPLQIRTLNLRKVTLSFISCFR